MGVKNIYERFIWFDDRVRQKKYPNTTSIAKEFEVSVKTAQRDIEFMRDRLNCPLQYDSSLKGYFYADETFSLPLIYLSSGELLSLMVAKKLLEDMSGSCMADEISSVLDKITSIIRKHSSGTSKMDEVLSFHLIEYSPTPEEIFRTILEACIKKKALSFNYRSPARDEMTERRVDPYHLFNYMGTWHLIGYCHMRNDIRTFKINRIKTPQVLRDSFAVRRNFSFRDYFLSSFGLYKGEEPVEVKIRFTPETSKWVSDHVWHKDQKTSILEDGSLEVSFPVAQFAEIAREILKHGSGVEVIDPESLRQLIKEEAEKILKIYQ
jgi:predicted DNA-binding transcriptional regulator YafY